MEHSTGYPVIAHLEEIAGDGSQSHVVVCFSLQSRVVVENCAKDVQEHFQRVLVQEVDSVQTVHCEVEVGISHG